MSPRPLRFDRHRATRPGRASLLALSVALAGCVPDDAGAPSSEGTAFALLEESHRLRNAGDFDAARSRLERALQMALPGSDAAASIRDELHYSLPLAQARRLARDGDTAAIPPLLAPVREYIRDHPDRFVGAAL